VAPTRIAKSVYVFEQGHFGLPPGLPGLAPYEFRLQCLEEGLDDSVVEADTLKPRCLRRF